VQLGLRDGPLVEVAKWQRPGKDGSWEEFDGTEEFVISNPAALSDGQAVTVGKRGDRLPSN